MPADVAEQEAHDPGLDPGPDPASADQENQPWWKQGDEPDYRATLANERTYLAWSRTALALLAGALAVLQVAKVAPLSLRVALACYLIVLSMGVMLTGYYRWRARQRSMRHNQPFEHSQFPAALCLAMLILAGLVGSVIAYSLR